MDRVRSRLCQRCIVFVQRGRTDVPLHGERHEFCAFRNQRMAIAQLPKAATAPSCTCLSWRLPLLTRRLRLSFLRIALLLGLLHLALKHVRHGDLLALLAPLILARPIR